MEPHWRISIETSGRKGSAAIGRGRELLAEQRFATDTEHARDMLPVLQQLFAKQGAAARQIEHCYVSIGPGSFTGLRVAVTFARHLALAVGAKLVAVPTLEVIAANAMDMVDRPERLAVILDAKRKQVFGAIFEKSGSGAYAQVVPPCLIEPGSLFARAQPPLTVIGEGIRYHQDAIRSSGVAVVDEAYWYPTAGNVYKLGAALAEGGRFVARNDLIPFYIRRPEAEELWEKRSGT